MRIFRSVGFGGVRIYNLNQDTRVAVNCAQPQVRADIGIRQILFQVSNSSPFQKVAIVPARAQFTLPLDGQVLAGGDSVGDAPIEHPLGRSVQPSLAGTSTCRMGKMVSLDLAPVLCFQPFAASRTTTATGFPVGNIVHMDNASVRPQRIGYEQILNRHRSTSSSAVV